MQHPKDIRIEDYTYNLPDERIAKYPLQQRDASKLLVYNNGTITDDTYQNIATHIQPDALMVFNHTKVVQARLVFTKDTGGAIEVFCLEPHKQYADIQLAMQQTHSVLWTCMVGGAAKWKDGLVLQKRHNDFTLKATIEERNEGSFTIKLDWSTGITFAEVLQALGNIPLPPYLNRNAEKSDEERYQTIYAKNKGSVAAPTAGLHFTHTVLDNLKSKGVDTAFVNLHVGAGTFMPVKSDTVGKHTMHAEWMSIHIDTLQQLIKHIETGIIAVGTTSMRMLESLYWIGVKLLNHIVPDFAGYAVTQWEPYEMEQTADSKTALEAVVDYLLLNKQTSLVTRTQILIAPSYKSKIVKALVTNFHQPQSTLLLLVSSLLGDDWRKLYDHALQNDYRFLSYGDGCLLYP